MAEMARLKFQREILFGKVFFFPFEVVCCAMVPSNKICYSKKKVIK